MRGRKPKTAAQQIAEGDPRKRGTRKLSDLLEVEPKAARGLPRCPKHLRDGPGLPGASGPKNSSK